MNSDIWVCVRQRAGPLTKECRYQRPHLSRADLPSVRREKNKILGLTRGNCFRRTPQDRLELMLALFGRNATVYTMTFRDTQLPGNFAEVRNAWRTFLVSTRRWHGGPFDYVYAIEGKHGDRRYHIHLVLRNEDFSGADIRYLWGGGYVDAEPLLRSETDSFRRMAIYLTKERTDGIVHPIGSRTWVASQSLYRKLPQPERTTATRGTIMVPPSAGWVDTYSIRNPFGAYRYAAYIR